MSEVKLGRPVRRSSNSSISSRASNVSFSEKVRRESTAKFDNFMKECRAAYLAVLSSTTEKITSIDELILALQFGGRNPSMKFVQKYWRHDTDSISYNDFCDIMRKEKPLNKDSILKAFKCIDKNGDGFITYDELFTLLTKRGERMTKSEVQEILDDADINNDGKLDYNEFAALLVSTADDCKQKSLKKLAKADDDTTSSYTPQSSINKRQSINKQNIQEPDNLKDWYQGCSKGSFFIDGDGIITSHQFKLHLTKDSDVFVTIQPTANKKVADKLKTMDMAVFCVDKNSELVTFTESKLGPKYCFHHELGRGTYSLISFTTGCRLSVRKSTPGKKANLTTGSGENMKLSKTFREALTDIFDRCDLDGNGYLSREEFDFFQMKSGGEQCDDDAWEIMKDNFEVKDDEITLKGFLDLNMMEAQDADGDPNDLWLTLENMGFNKALELDQSCPFLLEVFSNKCRPTLQVNSILENRNDVVEKAVVTSVLNNISKKENVRGMRDLILYKYESAIRVTLVLQNTSHSDVVVRVDCSNSKNCLSHRGDLDYTIKLEANSTGVVHHFVPQDARREWGVKHSLTIEQ
ncbi:EF-hand calcium-binding domain-containing protein 7-like isoform X1 [Orbicella faveolata]|uniref:EF-hand calcium-binding domain-containing protein 7-like isoform X1 n=1 Tax=Orbicella faveolata TaxID=48498 RepID=UPI0009E33758|nr:EF-hand calcium-binding domain-containing protein 7-like isoform X1 [Orbicella faveolata]